MKTISKYIVSILALGASAAMTTGCTDYLDKAPESEISGDEAFKNFKNFQGFTEEIYFGFPDFAKRYWNNSFNWGDDELINVGIDYMMGYFVDQGNFWGWQREHDGWNAGWMDNSSDFDPKEDRFHRGMWPGCWYAIRKANMGLENMDKMTEATQEQRDMIKGQLLFFRGFAHFQLMQYFGGMPYIDYVLPAGEKLTLPRLSYAECANKAADDLREAANLLPINWDNTATGAPTRGNNELRINKIMALGYLGKNLLWAGSPLMNKVVTGDTGYEKEFCKRAAEAFGELLTLVESGKTQYALVPFKEYKDNFFTMGRNGLMPGSTEAIFRVPSDDWNGSNWGQTKDYGSQLVTTSGVTFIPTANYVAFYGMANGLPLDDPDSGFDKAHPWKDRDPRFYHDIRFDGCTLEFGGNKAADAYRYAPLYTDGALRDVRTGSRTGYLNYKFIDSTCNQWDDGYTWGNSTHLHIPYMRLADIYLMYAEAAANAAGNPAGKSSNCSLSAEDAINVIRDRAGVEHVNAKYTGSIAAFNSEVRRERAVELAFESHRFNDLRRWLLLDKAPYNVKTSIEFQRVGDLDTKHPEENEVIGFHEEVILTRDFSDKHYWLPLKVSDTSMYPEFGQNPGW